MDTLSLGGQRVKYGGFVVAVIGFVLTRSTVTESTMLQGNLLNFVLGPALFLLLGLGLTSVGVALAVSSYDARFVNIVALWTVLGVGSMALVVVFSAAGSGSVIPRESRLVVNVLLGGAVGGHLTGLRSAANYRDRRTLARQRDRLTVFNRLLRHEVLNKVNVIRGWTDVATDGGTGRSVDSLAIIDRNAARIGEAIEQVGVLARTTDEAAAEHTVVLDDVLEREVTRLESAFPDARIEVSGDVDVAVTAVDGIDTVLGQLLENAVEHTGDAPRVRVTVSADRYAVSLRIEDDGPGLPREQRVLLEERALPEYDDPSAGFGLTIVRLLLEQTGGGIRVETRTAARESANESGDGDDDANQGPDNGATQSGDATEVTGTAITVDLPRANATEQIGVAPRTLTRTAGVAVVAGVGMGAVLQSTTGDIAIVGALYGIESGAVGWLTHLFHSVAFGLLFAALCAHPKTDRFTRSPWRTVGLAVGFGLFLWVAAAGVLMPLWLRAIGLAAPLPNLALVGFLGHLVWGALLGGGLVVAQVIDH